MNHYVLNIMQPEGPPPPAAIMDRIMKDVGAFDASTRAAGVLVFNGALAEPGATTVVRVRDGKTRLTDGPFAEAKEFVGGFVIIRVPTREAALAWGEQLGRATTLPIEVRPFQHVG